MKRALGFLAWSLVLMAALPVATATAAEQQAAATQNVQLAKIVIEPFNGERQYAPAPTKEALDINGVAAIVPHVKAILPEATKYGYAIEQSGTTAAFFIGVDRGLAPGQRIVAAWKLNCGFLNTQFSIAGPPELASHETGRAIMALRDMILAFAKTQPVHRRDLKANQVLVLKETKIGFDEAEGYKGNTHVEVILTRRETVASATKPEVNRIASIAIPQE